MVLVGAEGGPVRDTPPSLRQPGNSESRMALASDVWSLTIVVGQTSLPQSTTGAVVIVTESVVSVTEHPDVVEQVVLQELGFALHWTPHDEAVLVVQSELDCSLALLGLLGGLGLMGSGKSDPPPGPQPMRQG